MNCIDEQLLQKYIDGECTEKESAMIKQHLDGCLACHQKHAEMEKLSAGIKGALNTLTAENIEIPPFRNRTARSLSYYYPLIYSLSAACIILFVLFFANKKSESPQGKIAIVQCIPAEVDANRPAGEQDFVIEVYNDKGQSSEYFIK